jgi:hypothetical protein
MHNSGKLARTSRYEQRHSIPNRDPHGCDYRVGQAGLDGVRRGKSSSTCDVWNGKKQTFRPAFTSNECNGCRKNPKHAFYSPEKQSRAHEEQGWQYKQTYQNSSTPTKHIGVNEMRGHTCANGYRPKHDDRHWLAAKVREQKKPQPEHAGQGEQATKAEQITTAIPLFAVGVAVFDFVWHGPILLPANLSSQLNHGLAY